eukprot:gnl/Spiro4/8383_TR4405_c0_g1_i1.p1 gnl/Spiro4/8383_TR4405_c0_g1~~gnl/Spiro4/8383_TR4405_c0_g1_i1.p1  ORF type:complete len:277 (+),score=66.87 gnl/Spiro4/8383_TR4405_c0_g1_i1:66-896(+)
MDLSSRRSDNVLVVAGSFIARLAKRHYIISSAWLVGLLICFFFSGFQPPQEALTKYNEQMLSIDFDSLHQSYYDMVLADQRYYDAKGWFWQCDSRCQVLRSSSEAAHQRYDKLNAAVNAELAQAKSNLGVFSVQGVDETRSLFWQRFRSGTEFGKRQTLWDILFHSTRSLLQGSDESFLEFALRVVLNGIFNFTLGLIGGLVWFVCTLWGVISSFQPSWIESLVFFLCAVLAGTAFVALVLTVLIGGGVGTVVAVGYVALQRRIEAPERPERAHLA